MPIYEYKGQFYELSETDPAAAKAKITANLDQQYENKRSSALDFLPKGVPAWMQSAPGQADTAAPAGGDEGNPFAYLSNEQKTVQGPAMQAVSQGVNRGVQVGAGLAKGAIINPVAAVAQVAGGQTGRDFAQATQEAYDTQRKNAGATGFDWAELAGSVISPVNKFIPAGGTGIAGRGALGGVIGAALNPVTGTDLTAEDVAAGKVEQMGLGAIAGRFGSYLAGALTPTLRPGVRELMDKGIPVTPGQAYEGIPGALYRQIEKLDLPGMRVDKDAINLAFTKSTGDDVLSIVGEKLPDNMKNGQQIFGYIQNKLTKYYDDALDKIGPVRPDQEFTAGITQARNALAEGLGDNSPAVKGFQNFIKSNVMSQIDDTGAISSKSMKRLEEIFQARIDKINAVDTPGDLTKAAYDDAYKALKGLLIRNDDEGNIAKANLAYMQRSRIMEATQKNAAEIGAAGTYSPAEMAKVAAKQGGDIESALGTAPLQAEATKALNVVGDTTHEAQRFRNLMIAGKLTGLGALGLFSPAIALPLLTASGMAYKTAQKLMDEPSKLRLAVQSALKNNPALAGQVAGNLLNQNNAQQPAQEPAPQPQKAPQSFSMTGGKLSAAYPAINSLKVGSAGQFNPEHPIAQKVMQEAERQGLGDFKEVLVRQAFQESKFNPTAKSSANARGVMQIVPGTARDLGLKDPYNPDDNIRAGVEYMGQLLKRYDYDVKKALAAYNGGMKRIDKTGLTTLKPETRQYLKNILGE